MIVSHTNSGNPPVNRLDNMIRQSVAIKERLITSLLLSLLTLDGYNILYTGPTKFVTHVSTKEGGNESWLLVLWNGIDGVFFATPSVISSCRNSRKIIKRGR